MLIVNQEIEKELYLHAKTKYPEECCGILLGKREGAQRIAYKVIPTENVGSAPKRATQFIIDPLNIAQIELSAEQEQLEIIGFYHSYPDYEAIVSEADTLYMIAGYSYPIISVTNGICTKIACFEKNGQVSAEVRKEKIMIQGESSNADSGIYISNIASICESKSKCLHRGNDRS